MADMPVLAGMNRVPEPGSGGEPEEESYEEGTEPAGEPAETPAGDH